MSRDSGNHLERPRSKEKADLGLINVFKLSEGKWVTQPIEDMKTDDWQ